MSNLLGYIIPFLLTTQIFVAQVIGATPNVQPRGVVHDFNDTSIINPVSWTCPDINGPGIECTCELAHTLHCSTDSDGWQVLSSHLRKNSPDKISLLDATVSNLTILPRNFLTGVALHGLVLSSGRINQVSDDAFAELGTPLQALGLPNNQLDAVPSEALSGLTGLERLDLSNNLLRVLKASAFQGLANLTHLDLSDNSLALLFPRFLAATPKLRVLKMRGNQLTAAALLALRGVTDNLEELDLSRNRLEGPVTSDLLPNMPQLLRLSLAENGLRSVLKDALQGLKNLATLDLSRNKIEVLEDHAFRQLTNLVELDFQHNDVVAVSSASLTHLKKLRVLDLSHNFLRTISSDIVLPLGSLRELRLDDNEITMVSSELVAKNSRLRRLSLADNPLNCDCTLLEFYNWLANSSALPDEDKRSAVCATPPNLENGLLIEVEPEKLFCGDQTAEVAGNEDRAVMVGSDRLTLEDFHYDEETGAKFLWHMEKCTEPYTCRSLIVYERPELEAEEVQIAIRPIQCNSRLVTNPCFLPVSLPAKDLPLKPDHFYRYCVVLTATKSSKDSDLGLGCSDLIRLEKAKPTGSNQPPAPEITDLQVNISNDGNLLLQIGLQGRPGADCDIEIVVNTSGSGEVRRSSHNCSQSIADLEGLVPGSYEICASLGQHQVNNAHCVQVQMMGSGRPRVLLAFLGIGVIALLLLVLAVVLRRPQDKATGGSQVRASELEAARKTKYIKLLATTKV